MKKEVTEEEPDIPRSITTTTSTEAPKLRSDGKKLVPKGTLNLEELIEAKNQATSKAKDNMTEEERKQAMRAANRLSAFTSRQRKKQIIDDLRKTVSQLSRDNEEKRTMISTMQAELDKVNHENAILYAHLEQVKAIGQLKQAEPAPAAPAVSNDILCLLGKLASANQSVHVQARTQPAPAPHHSLKANIILQKQLNQVKMPPVSQVAAVQGETGDLSGLINFLKTA